MLPIWITVAFSTVDLNFSLVASGPVMGSTLRYDDTARNSRIAAGRYTSEGLHSQSCKSSLRKKFQIILGEKYLILICDLIVYHSQRCVSSKIKNKTIMNVKTAIYASILYISLNIYYIQIK